MNRGAPPQAELVQAGDAFRRERVRRQIELAHVARDTKIRLSLLSAIEAGAASELPTPVFARGLVRTYARYLGIDPRSFLAAYASVVMEPPPSAGLPHRHDPVRGGRSQAGLLISIVTMAGLLLLGAYLYQQYAAFVTGEPFAMERPPGQVMLISTPLPSPPAYVQPAATPSAVSLVPVTTLTLPTPRPTVPATPTLVPLPTATPIRGVHLDAIAVARVWLHVETDDKLTFEGFLNVGDRKSWNANQKIFLWSGNASGLTLTYNGKPVGSLGAPGEVVKVTWTATS